MVLVTSEGRDRLRGGPLAASKAALAAAALLVTLTGCSEAGIQVDKGVAGQPDPSHVPTHGPEIDARPISPYGTVLTTGTGYPLYVFAPDDAKRVTCSGDCAVSWPPLHPTGSPKAIAGKGVQVHLLGTDPDSSGQPVVTYNGWPLYLYAADAGPGFVSGQGLDSDGGYWYLIRNDGTVVKTAA
jgi:predicted lipoprotein with Yx(FWY)xxD motif